MINVLDIGMRVVALLVACALLLGLWWFSSKSNTALALEFLYLGSLLLYVSLPRIHLQKNKYTFSCTLLLLASGVAAIFLNHAVSNSQHILLDNIPLVILLTVQTVLIAMTFAIAKSKRPMKRIS